MPYSASSSGRQNCHECEPIALLLVRPLVSTRFSQPLTEQIKARQTRHASIRRSRHLIHRETQRPGVRQ